MAVCEVYADCAASCPPLRCAQEAMLTWNYANPNSVHAAGRESRKHLEWAREIIAKCINAQPSEIYFTPSATHACWSAVDLLEIGNRSAHEHSSVEHACAIRSINGINQDAYAHMLANNETGERYDLTVMDLAKHYDVFTDATAAVGQIPVDVQKLGVVALAAGAHKFGGLPGVGFLYVRGGVSRRFEKETFYPGTPPVGLAVAMASALEYRTEHMRGATVYLTEQKEKLALSILGVNGTHINSDYPDYLSNILSVRFDGVNARELLTMLDVNGVCASAGSACTADSDEPSRVLLASGLTEEQALSTIRLSFCPETTPDEFSFVADALRRSVTQLRELTK